MGDAFTYERLIDPVMQSPEISHHRIGFRTGIARPSRRVEVSEGVRSQLDPCAFPMNFAVGVTQIPFDLAQRDP
jgi:hypothetical protein